MSLLTKNLYKAISWHLYSSLLIYLQSTLCYLLAYLLVVYVYILQLCLKLISCLCYN